MRVRVGVGIGWGRWVGKGWLTSVERCRWEMGRSEMGSGVMRTGRVEMGRWLMASVGVGMSGRVRRCRREVGRWRMTIVLAMRIARVLTMMISPAPTPASPPWAVACGRGRGWRGPSTIAISGESGSENV